jgi:hypothetical protein
MSSSAIDAVPCGRNLDDYIAMFALSDADRSRSIVSYGDGPSSFNAEATAKGMRVVSVDAIYDFRAQEIQSKISDTPVTQQFLQDYPEGLAQGRYVTGTLPDLPFMDSTYDLALCSHILFLHSEQRDANFHVSAIQELCRVAEEVRISPLSELAARPSRHLPIVEAALQELGYQVSRLPVAVKFPARIRCYASLSGENALLLRLFHEVAIRAQRSQRTGVAQQVRDRQQGQRGLIAQQCVPHCIDPVFRHPLALLFEHLPQLRPVDRCIQAGWLLIYVG